MKKKLTKKQLSNEAKNILEYCTQKETGIIDARRLGQALIDNFEWTKGITEFIEYISGRDNVITGYEDESKKE